MKATNSIFSGLAVTIFEEMSRLAIQHGAINLGQGFPDEEGPQDIRRVAAETVMEGPNQYPPMMGVPALRQAVAAANKRFWGLDVDWEREVMVTSGATEALADCLFALIEPGDEVVLIEPLYDCYLPMVRRAGGIPKLVRIEPPAWDLPIQALSDAFSDKTKLILLNTPHNPAGKVFRRDELAVIAGLLERFDAYALCDEVYEHLVFSGAEHVPLMTLPGMRERCVRIGSAGKTFNATGWKVGYITAPAALLQPIAKAHQFVTFTTPPNLQKAAAFGLSKDDSYFNELSSKLEKKRDRLAAGLKQVGFDVMAADGAYFLTADFSPLGLNGNDGDVCRRLTAEAGVATVPVSAFYSAGGPDHFIRFCFCKRDEVLDGAVEKLRAYFGR